MTPADTQERPLITLQMEAIDLDAILRVLMQGRLKVDQIRDRLEWFYRYRGVPRPEKRSAPPSKVVQFRRVCLQRLARSHGPAVAAIVEKKNQMYAKSMLEIALRLEAELAIAERAAARRGAKRKVKRKARGA